MKAMIFAAGLGTRLQPITDHVPKALVPVLGRPMLEHLLLKLKHSGFDEVIINVHYLAEQIIDFLAQNNYFDMQIAISDERDQLLDTGGGIKKAKWFFDDERPFLVHNVDIFSDLDFATLYQQHLTTDALATLVVNKRDTFRYLLFDENNRLKAWVNETTGITKPANVVKIDSYQKLAFAGIQVLSPKIFDCMHGTDNKFSIIDFYLLQVDNYPVNGFIPENFHVLDVGKHDTLHDAPAFVEKYCKMF